MGRSLSGWSTSDGPDRRSGGLRLETTPNSADASASVGLNDEMAEVTRIPFSTIEELPIEHDPTTDAG